MSRTDLNLPPRRRPNLVALLNLVHLLVFSWVALILAGTSATAFGSGTLTGLLILAVWGVIFLALQVLLALTTLWRRRETRQAGKRLRHALLADLDRSSTAA